jgi:hypothetical protein
VTEYQLPEQKTEFPYRPVVPMIKDKLINLLKDKNVVLERLKTLQLALREEPAKGYSENNLLNLLAQFHENNQ